MRYELTVMIYGKTCEMDVDGLAIDLEHDPDDRLDWCWDGDVYGDISGTWKRLDDRDAVDTKVILPRHSPRHGPVGSGRLGGSH